MCHPSLPSCVFYLSSSSSCAPRSAMHLASPRHLFCIKSSGFVHPILVGSHGRLQGLWGCGSVLWSSSTVLSFTPCRYPGRLKTVQSNRSLRLKVRPHLHANTNEAGRGEAYANICLDCNTRQNVVICRVSEWFSLKYRLPMDSVRSVSDQQRQFSSPRLHVYITTHALPRPASRAFLF